MIVEFSIYQLPKEHDLVWRSYKDWEKIKHKSVTLDDYKKVYSGEKYVYGDSNALTALSINILEEIFADFNINRPDDYTGRSLSVSDVVSLTLNFERVYNDEKSETRYYYCDDIGWVRI